MLRELEAFQQSQAYRLLFEADWKDAIRAAKFVARSSPDDIAQFFGREQSIGQLTQMEITLEWLPSKIEELRELIEQYNDNEQVATEPSAS